MKRILLLLILLSGVLVWGGPVKPGPVVDPAPVEDKPVLIEPYTWLMYGKPVAYYYRVKMPDGTTQEIKIRPEAGKLAPTAKDWQAKADAAWIASKPDPNNVPKPCPYCRGTGVMP